MAGKVGSYITSSLGTMKVTEQIDALQVMGINTYNYLIFPKIIAMLFYPFVITISMFLGIFGGYIASIYGDFCSSADFIEGIQMEFIPYHVKYAFLKTRLTHKVKMLKSRKLEKREPKNDLFKDLHF